MFGSDTLDGWCDLRKVCSLGRFLPKVTSFRGEVKSHDALLIPRKDGSFIIPVDPAPPQEDNVHWELARHRNRFRVAHEVGHSFFYDRGSAPPRRLLAPSEEEERFCDEFAAELLIPQTAVRRSGFTPQDIFSIHALYDVSVEASSRAVSRAHPDLSIAGIIWRPSRRTKEPALRVVWCAGPRFIPVGMRLNSEAVDRASSTGNCYRVEEFDFDRLEGRYHVWAGKLPGRKQLVAVLQPVAHDRVEQNSPKDSFVTERLLLD